MNIEQLQKLQVGLQRIGYGEFDKTLTETAGGVMLPTYSRILYKRFQEDRFGWLATHPHASMGQALLNLALRKAEDP